MGLTGTLTSGEGEVAPRRPSAGEVSEIRLLSWASESAVRVDYAQAAIHRALPGRVTVLGNPALVGTLGLESWVGGLYDRARGGRLGLVVLTMPGGAHDGRLRLNETWALGDAKVMGAVFLASAVVGA